MEQGFITCIIPQFPVEKLEGMRVVWDCTGNGHNVTLLWAPGLMVSSFNHVENMVVKWLTVAVDHYKKPH